MSTAKRRFASIAQTGAEILHKGFRAAHEAGFTALTLTVKGAWVGRRFVIVGMRAVEGFPHVRANPLSRTLTLPSTATPMELMQALHSFGAYVEAVWRENMQDRFDLVVSAADGDRHVVPRFDHVAACGHEPTQWLGKRDLGPLADQIQMCTTCLAAPTGRRHISTPKPESNAGDLKSA